jgi:hypothetical protein
MLKAKARELRALKDYGQILVKTSCSFPDYLNAKP